MLNAPNRAHLPPSPRTGDLTDALKALWADGLSASYIAGELGSGLTRNAVTSKVHRLGLPTRRTARARTKSRANNDRSATQRIKMVRLHKQPVFGGPIVNVAEVAVHEPDPDLTDFNAAIPSEQRRTLLQLTKATCHFPCGDVGEPGFFFCGGKVTEGPYCNYHSRVCYRPSARPVVRPYYATGGSKPAVF